jgi:hypothetical protein
MADDWFKLIETVNKRRAKYDEYQTRQKSRDL